jgi:cyclopropane fatty-acyl-phospholipid synthase-like methyltransferase
VPIDKPCSPSCERNRGPILDVLRRRFRDCRNVIEIGSGTGQHAVHFAAAMPWLCWQASDVAGHLPGIRQWLGDAGLPNTPAPIALDVTTRDGIDASLVAAFDAAFSANTLHIMAWPAVADFFRMLDAMLAPAATVVVYGPFNDGGAYTSDSNRVFDAWLKERDPESGLRDFEAVDALATAIGLQLSADIAMPANNRCLVWRRG